MMLALLFVVFAFVDVVGCWLLSSLCCLFVAWCWLLLVGC